MLLVNEQPLPLSSFPDGTAAFRLSVQDGGPYVIQWLYDGDEECILLWHLTHHIRENCPPQTEIHLVLPYVPNARMDRVKQNDEVFTLKWFANFINALNFTSVTGCDVHSNVASALFHRFRQINAGYLVEQTLKEISSRFHIPSNKVILCYPDEGASKRYSEQISKDYVFGIKHRDWRTGKIQKLELVGAQKVAGKPVLIVDDICSRGGTFTYTAKALKEAGAQAIFLYVTHCENTIREGSVLTDGLITHVFTTNSIFRGNHEKVTAGNFIVKGIDSNDLL